MSKDASKKNKKQRSIMAKGHMKPVLSNIGDDRRCDVHSCVLSIREGKDGWFELYCPGGVASDSDGEVYATLVSNILLCVLI